MTQPPGAVPTLSPERGSGLALAAATVGLALLLALIGVAHHWLRPLRLDDAFIHFRYAENIARGEGFVYNAGERVLGSGGALWNGLLALVARATGAGALPDAVSALNYGALVGCAVVAAVALARIVPAWLAVVMAGTLVAQGPLLASSIGGMETTLLCLLHFLTFLALVEERYALAGLAAGTAIGLRIESVALAGAALLATLLHRPRATWRAAITAALVPVALTVWAWVYFGSPVPTSTLAKKTAYVLPPLTAFVQSLDALLEVFPFHRLVGLAPAYPALARGVGVAIWLTLIQAGFFHLRRRRPAAALVALQPLGAVVFYAFTNPLIFSWYACTFVPLATLLAMLGMRELLAHVPRVGASRDALVALLIVACSALSLATFWLPFVPPDDARFSFDHPVARGSARTYQYAHVGRWLSERARPGDRVCISEIGAFGYHFRGRILDGLGLVSPEVLPYHPLPEGMRRNGAIGAIPPRAVRDFRPEFVVSLDLFADALFADPWFQSNYDPIGRWSWFGGPVRWHDLPASLWGASEIRAYRRRDVRWQGAPGSATPDILGRGADPSVWRSNTRDRHAAAGEASAANDHARLLQREPVEVGPDQ
jgi:hypothetical protein